MVQSKEKSGPFYEKLELLLVEEYGGKQELLAEALGVDPATVWRWFERKTYPQRRHHDALGALWERASSRRFSAALGHTVRDLYEGVESC